MNTLRACGYKLLDYPRTSRTGEGTGVLFRDNLTVKKGATAELRSFEYSEWDNKSEADRIHLIIVLHSLRYMGPKIWAIVPRNVRELTSISSFKCNIRRIDLVSKLTDSKCENCLLCKT